MSGLSPAVALSQARQLGRTELLAWYAFTLDCLFALYVKEVWFSPIFGFATLLRHWLASTVLWSHGMTVVRQLTIEQYGGRLD